MPTLKNKIVIGDFNFNLETEKGELKEGEKRLLIEVDLSNYTFNIFLDYTLIDNKKVFKDIEISVYLDGTDEEENTMAKLYPDTLTYNRIESFIKKVIDKPMEYFDNNLNQPIEG